jgi:hypothetical protein
VVLAGEEGFALASGLAYVAYLIPPEGQDQAITAWNLLIIPTALYLGDRVASRGPLVSAASTAAGVTASFLWAFAYRSPSPEPWLDRAGRRVVARSRLAAADRARALGWFSRA